MEKLKISTSEQSIIKAAEKPKLRDLGELERYTSIKVAMITAGVISNATPPNLENEEEAAVFQLMIKLIEKHFSDFTGSEIVEAFEINILGNEWEKVKPYSGLTFEMVAEVLKNYRIIRNKAMASLHRAIENQQQEERIAAAKTTDKEQYDFIRDYFFEQKEWPIGNYTAAFNHIWKSGGHKNPEEWKEWCEKAEETVRKMWRNEAAMAITIKERMEHEKMHSYSHLQDEIKKLFVKEHIAKLKDTGGSHV